MDIMDIMGMGGNDMFGGGMFGGGLGGIGEAVVAYVIAVILGIAGAIVIYCMFARAKKRPLFLHRPRLLLLHDFLNYKKMWSPWFNKLLYLLIACVMNLCYLVEMFSSSFFGGLLSMVFANIILRGLFELITVTFSIHTNLNLITDMLLGRERDDGVSAEQVFAGLGSQIRARQQEMRERAEARRAQEEAAYMRAQDGLNRQAPPFPQPLQYQPPQQPEPQAPPPAKDASAEPKAFCPKCGKPLDGLGSFCPKCGAPV